MQLKYCPTEHVIADMFTKGLPQDKFAKLIHVAEVRAYLQVRRSVGKTLATIVLYLTCLETYCFVDVA